MDIDVSFDSHYDDYKYIVEATITDENSNETVSTSNSLIARLPAQYKKWSDTNTLQVTPEKLFVRVGEPLKFTARLMGGAWGSGYNGVYALDIKKKVYTTERVTDVRGFRRPILSTSFESVYSGSVDTKNFTLGSSGVLSLTRVFSEPGEYIITTTNTKGARNTPKEVSIYVW